MRFCVAVKYAALFLTYAELGDKFIPLPRYHSDGDSKHGVALRRMVGLGCNTCSTTDMKVAVEGRAHRAVGACSALGNTGVRS